MAQEPKHISVPRPFGSGNVVEWLHRFNICAKANGWNDATKAVKLPTLLEGEALAVWLDLTEEQQTDHSATVGELKKKLTPSGFSSLEAFHTRKLQPGEALSLFVQDLKQKLQHAMPDIGNAARNQLLLHQFLAGLPVKICKQLRAAGDVTSMETALERARLLMSLEAEQEQTSCTAAVTSAPQEQQVQQLKEQVDELTAQVATLVHRAKPMPQGRPSNLQRCFYCDKIGHFQQNCPKRVSDNRRCYACGKLGHVEKNCWQGNYNRASLLPVGPSDDQVVTVSAVKCNAAILTGELAGKIMEMMIDSGSAVSLVMKQEVDVLKHDRLLNAPVPKLRLVTASGEPMLITGCIQAPVRISQLEITHQFLVVERLVTPVILGVDFLQQHNLVLNFASSPVAISNPTHLVE